MNDNNSFRRIAAISAIISAPLALGASIVLAWAIGFNLDLGQNPAGLLTLGTRVAGIFRVVEFIGMFAYYLLLLPATLYLWYWLKPQAPNLVLMYTILGLGYIFIGTIAEAVLVSVLPPMMSAYPQASVAQSELLTAIFPHFTNLSISALFSLSYVFGGIWWLGIGLILCVERRILGIVTVAQGIITLGYVIGVMLLVEPLRTLEPLTFFNPIWALWIGVVIARGTGRSEHSTQVARSN